MPKKTVTARLYIEVTFDPKVTDAEALANAFDHVIDTALSTGGLLDDYGEISRSEVRVLES